MIGKLSRTLLAAAALAFGLSGAAVSAEDDDDGSGAQPGWGMGRMMDGWGMGAPFGGFWAGGMMDRMDGRIAYLKTELKITDAQAPAWDAFAAALRTTAEKHNVLMRAMMDEMHDGSFFKKTLPERLAFQETHMAARLEQVQTVKAAADTLYAALDDTQKKAADEIVLPAMGMGMMGMMGGRGMMGGMGRGMMMMER